MITLTNMEIYNMATILNEEFADGSLKLPIKINFFLQKNIQTLLNLTREIEDARLEVARKYGELTEDGTSYQVPEESIADASKELNELFEASQEVNIHIFKIDDLEGIDLTMNQMNALMPMIEE